MAVELDGAKRYLRGLFPIQTATQSGLSNVLNNVYVFGLPTDYPETFRAKVAAITPAQVKSAAATLLGSENSVIVIVGDYGKVKDQLAQAQGEIARGLIQVYKGLGGGWDYQCVREPPAPEEHRPRLGPSR